MCVMKSRGMTIGRSQLSKIRMRSQAEVVLFHQLAERAAFFAGFARRLRHVPRMARQEVLDVAALELFDRLPPGALKALAGDEIAFRERRFVGQNNVYRYDRLAFRTQGRPLHGVEKLTDVSRPGMVLDPAQGRGRKGLARPFRAELVIQKVLSQQRNIFPPLTQ